MSKESPAGIKIMEVPVVGHVQVRMQGVASGIRTSSTH